MTNVVILTGKVLKLPELKTTSKGNNVAHLTIESTRNYLATDGSALVDVYTVYVWRGAADNCMAICKPGDLVNIKGRLQTSSYEKNGKVYYNTEIVAEQIDYLNELL